VRAARYIVAVLVATGPQVRAESDAPSSAFAELHADWIHAVDGYAGVGARSLREGYDRVVV